MPKLHRRSAEPNWSQPPWQELEKAREGLPKLPLKSLHVPALWIAISGTASLIRLLR